MTNAMAAFRPDGRKAHQLRPVEFIPQIAPACAGSVLVKMGNTQVLCGVSVEESVPRWMKAQKVSGGWVTAEYSMLPYSTSPRTQREVTNGKIGGRTQEIQRLIGRSLRAIIDLDKLGARTLWVDCDVLQADGGTRTASITGAYVAVQIAIRKLLASGALKEDPVQEPVAAISVGICGGRNVLDLCYTEDVDAEVDMNVVMTDAGEFVEIQGTAESKPFSRRQMDALIALAAKGIQNLIRLQERALKGC